MQKPRTADSMLDAGVQALTDLLENQCPATPLPDALESHPGFLRLYHNLYSLRESTLALSQGDLSLPITMKGFVGGALRSLQASLRHLTWQTQQIAAGDFTQRVEFLGEFSTAFNAMTEALAKATAELKESEAYYRMLTENALDLISSIDLEGRFTYVSPSLVRLLGYTQHEVVGRKIEDMLTPNFVQPFQEKLQQLLASASTDDRGYAMELQMLRKDGSTIWTEITIAIQQDENGHQTGLIGVLRDITKRKQIQDQLIRLATIDALTGAPNRRHFMALGQREMARALRHSRPLSVLMIDIDHFKKVNDTHGHAAGDQVLQALVQVGTKALRKTDLFARLGGEEFGVLLPETDSSGAVHVAERLRKAFQETLVTLENGTSLSVTVSIGAASCGESVGSLEALLQQADEALYQAKRSGRNRVCLYTHAQPEQ